MLIKGCPYLMLPKNFYALRWFNHFGAFFLHQIRTKIPITRIAKQCIKFLHHECTMNNIHF